MDERDWPEALDQCITTVAAAEDTYSAAGKVMSCAAESLTTSVVASRLYQIWAGLTDWFELKPDERAEVVTAMRRAATEWESAMDRPSGRDQYLDHWQFEVLGYRP